MEKHDKINHPSHYVNAAVTLEPIELCQRLPFCIGNACKYLIRAGSKQGESEADDLKKARWYIERSLKTSPILESALKNGSATQYIASKFAEQNRYIKRLVFSELNDNAMTTNEEKTIGLISERLAEIEQKEGLKALWKGN